MTTQPTTAHAEQTLGELVTAAPRSARILERYGLDYCCGGQRPLREACADAGVDTDVVLGELSALGPEPPVAWATMAPAGLADHLEATHHAYLHAELPRLGALADKVAGVHGGRHPELHAVVEAFADLRADLEPHLAKEEQVLFPLIRALTIDPEPPRHHCGSIANPISVMHREHDQAGVLLERLRTASGDYVVPEDGCVSYRMLYEGLAELEADTHLHIHKENNLLFPAALELEAARR